MSDLLRPSKDARMAVLKPCPFCGSKWTQVRWIGFEDSPPCGHASGYRGECTDCGAMTLPALSVEAAEEAWNRRPTMGDYISRQKVERFIENGLNNPDKKKAFGHDAVEILTEVHYMDSVDVRPVVYCRDCIHRPYSSEPGKTSGFAVEAPDRECKCPCFNPDDGWYSWIPDDYFFCGNGERREGGTP